MEVTDCTKILHSKIQNIEPENATKIIGYLLLTYTQEEILDYAYGTEKQIQSLINEAKAYLASAPKSTVSMQPDESLQFLSSHTISRPYSLPSSFRVPAPHLGAHNSTDLLPSSYNDFSGILHDQAELMGLEEQLHLVNPLGTDYSSNFYYSDGQLGGGLGARIDLRSPTGLSEYPPPKACHYFYKGYCKHGNSCRYFHGQDTPDSFSQMYRMNPHELINDDHIFSLGSLEQLEVEISELLKARKGMPVSIASLPMMYLETYGKALQAEGYLTESQRHGKAGFSLTKLLARLNSIRLIDRPHGQHSVVLAEDASKYEYRNERSDLGGALPASSHQIYLTFPAESSFTDDDVMNYFKKFGPVRDVRIPRQEKRMFGFVSFHYPETVKDILTKVHQHNICGSRVLVKPYKEKTRIYDRKYTEKVEIPLYYTPQYFEMAPDSYMMPRVYENSSLLKKQLMEEHERTLELERMRLLGLQLTPKSLTSHSYFNYGMEDLKLPADHFIPLPVQNNVSTSDDKHHQTAKNYSDQDGGHIELPDSPFASPRLANNFYTVV